MNQRMIWNQKEYTCHEIMQYPNGGCSYFYVHDNDVVIIDKDIYKMSTELYPYTLITEKQNMYMQQYESVFRFVYEDLSSIDSILTKSVQKSSHTTIDRSESLDASPLEFLFESNFMNVYGTSSLKYLWKEYGITDWEGNTYYLDYVVNTKSGMIAVEENGIHYHHPQCIGLERYQKQLQKQNACALWNIKLFRFSTEDCSFHDRIEDDIRQYFGNSTDNFIPNGISVKRNFKLYEHQENTLEDIRIQRDMGIRSFLVVFPTASGKSKIVEEDLEVYSKNKEYFRVLILAPNVRIVEDWKSRIQSHAFDFTVDIYTYSYMSLHYMEMHSNMYSYIVIDEAHHAVAPTLKRVIQYFTPDFLIGLTATDQRLDNQRLESVFGNYQTSLSLQEAMEKKIIAQANVYRIETNIDLSKVRINGKEYVNADLEKSVRVTSRNELIGDVLQQYFCSNGFENKQGIVFCVNVEHALEMERVLNSYGIPAASYTRKTKNLNKVMERFEKKEIRFLCACQMISEGWDYPNLGIIVMARPTLSKVLYLQQIGRGLRKTNTKENVFIIDVVDEYGSMAKPCSMHSIFHNPYYVPFGSIIQRNYVIGDMITIEGLHETIERIIPVDIESFDEKYGDYLNQEQLAREFFISTSSIHNWIRKKRIIPDETISFGNRKIHLFSPENVSRIRIENNIIEHTEDMIKDDFFHFLEERDYSLSYKMPFLLSLLENVDSIGDANIDDVLDGYISFYEDRMDKGLPVDRSTCPYNRETIKDRSFIKRNMLTNPFEKFERKRFLYYSKDLNVISMNHALFSKLTEEDMVRIKNQMYEDLENYYSNIV